mgnify:FL=1
MTFGIFLIFVFFILGLCIGSFLNVIILRFPKEEKISGRSYCPHCKKTLAWYDLIPVLSFITLKGKCRYCKKPISWQYPIVELVTGILFAATFYLTIGAGGFLLGNLIPGEIITLLPELLFHLFFASLLIIIFTTDFKYMMVPDTVVFSGIGGSFAYQLFQNLKLHSWNFFDIWGLKSDMCLSIFSGLGAGLFFLLLVLVTKGKGMGIGDIKIAIFMGLYLSWPKIAVAICISFISGAIIGLVLIGTRKKGLKSEIPFACFLVPATFISLWFGDFFINWYTSLLIG